MAQFIRIKNWSTYQHYKDRNPPWIKLHRDLMTSETWVSLDDAGRVLAIAIMLLAAATDNKIKSDKRYIQRVAYLHAEPDFQSLVDIGFIEIIDENREVASTLQAAAIPEAEAYREEEEKKDVDVTRARAAHELSEKVGKITGWADSPNWFGDYARLHAWLAQGWSAELDILPEITRIVAMRKAKGKSMPVTLEYFEKAIADYRATRLNPPLQGTPNAPKPTGNKTERIDQAKRDALRDLGITA